MTASVLPNEVEDSPAAPLVVPSSTRKRNSNSNMSNQFSRWFLLTVTTTLSLILLVLAVISEPPMSVIASLPWWVWIILLLHLVSPTLGIWVCARRLRTKKPCYTLEKRCLQVMLVVWIIFLIPLSTWAGGSDPLDQNYSICIWLALGMGYDLYLRGADGGSGENDDHSSCCDAAGDEDGTTMSKSTTRSTSTTTQETMDIPSIAEVDLETDQYFLFEEPEQYTTPSSVLDYDPFDESKLFWYKLMATSSLTCLVFGFTFVCTVYDLIRSHNDDNDSPILEIWIIILVGLIALVALCTLLFLGGYSACCDRNNKGLSDIAITKDKDPKKNFPIQLSVIWCLVAFAMLVSTPEDMVFGGVGPMTWMSLSVWYALQLTNLWAGFCGDRGLIVSLSSLFRQKNAPSPQEKWSKWRKARFLMWSAYSVAAAMGLVALIIQRCFFDNRTRGPIFCVAVLLELAVFLFGLTALCYERVPPREAHPNVKRNNWVLIVGWLLAILTFLFMTYSKHNLATDNGGLWVRSIGIYMSVSTSLVVSTHLLITYLFPPLRAILNPAQMGWLPVALVSLLVPATTFSDYVTLSCPIEDEDGETICASLYLSGVAGACLCISATGMVAFEKRLPHILWNMIGLGVWIGLIVIWTAFAFPDDNSVFNLIGTPTLNASLGTGIALSSQGISKILWNAYYQKQENKAQTNKENAA